MVCFFLSLCVLVKPYEVLSLTPTQFYYNFPIKDILQDLSVVFQCGSLARLSLCLCTLNAHIDTVLACNVLYLYRTSGDVIDMSDLLSCIEAI